MVWMKTKDSWPAEAPGKLEREHQDPIGCAVSVNGRAVSRWGLGCFSGLPDDGYTKLSVPSMVFMK